MTGLAAAFRSFGAEGKNPRWSWSARTPDGTTVVMTLWKDKIDYSSKPISYSTFGSPTLGKWKGQPGNHERIDNLKWARDHCHSLMRVVIIKAVDERAADRQIAESYPQKNMVMKLTALNEDTGEFSAVVVEDHVVPKP
jgi:hypothetical protein